MNPIRIRLRLLSGMVVRPVARAPFAILSHRASGGRSRADGASQRPNNAPR